MASKVINLRVPEEQLHLIDRAAKARGQNRSEFICSQATRRRSRR